MKYLGMNLKELSSGEMKRTNGGIVVEALGLALAWMAIGAAICWSMAEDNREC